MNIKNYIFILVLSATFTITASGQTFKEAEYKKLNIWNFLPISETTEKASTACFRIFAQPNKFNAEEKHAITEETRIVLAKIINKKEAIKKEMEIKFKYFLTDIEIKQIQNNFENVLNCNEIIDFYWGTALNFQDIYEKDVIYQADDALGWTGYNKVNGRSIVIFTKYTFAGRLIDGSFVYIKPLGHTILHELMHYSTKGYAVTGNERVIDGPAAKIFPKIIGDIRLFHF